MAQVVKKGRPNNSPLSPHWSTGCSHIDSASPSSPLPRHRYRPDTEALVWNLALSRPAPYRAHRPRGERQRYFFFFLIVCSVSWSRWRQALRGQASSPGPDLATRTQTPMTK